MYVPVKEMLSRAKPGERAVGAFNALNLEQVQGVLEAAVEEQAPAIVSCSQNTGLYAGLEVYLAMVREMADQVPVPVAVLLDRVTDFDLIRRAASIGYSGMVYDLGGSPSTDKQSINNMQFMQSVFNEVSVSIVDYRDKTFREKINTILKEQAVDSISLALPPEDRNGPPRKFFETLSELCIESPVPVGLTGAGAWDDEDLEKAARTGVWKISLGTRLNRAFTDALRDYLEDNPDRISPRSYLAAARDGLRSEVKSCLRLINSSFSV